MKVLCSACSFEHELSPAKLADGVSCTKCGQSLGDDAPTLILPSLGDDAPTLIFPSREAAVTARSYSTPSRAREDMRTATKDLFGGTDLPRPVFITAMDIELEKDVPTPRASENSIMFSLESLMKGRNKPKAPSVDAMSENHLLDMQGVAPLFGTAHDQALLTTPMRQPTPPAHTMTLPRRRPPRKGGAWKWVASAVGVCGVAAAGWWGLQARSTIGAGSHVDVAPEAPPVVAAPVEDTPPPADSIAAVPSPEVAPAPTAEATLPSQAEPAPPSEPANGQPAVATAPPSGVPPAGAVPPAPAANLPTSAVKAKVRPDKKPVSSTAKNKPGVVGLPFNKAVARDALTSASGKASACKGASGSGKVQLTFAPSGKVSDASITSGSFPASASACILRAFRATRVPPFGGLPVSVAKSFKIP